MKTRRTLAWLSAVVVLTAGAAAAQDWKPSALAAFDTVWQTVNDRFHDPSFGGLNWAAVKSELRPKAEAATTPEMVRNVIRDMLARLHQSHFALISASSDADAVSGDAIVPIEFRVTAAGTLITSVDPRSQVYRAGVRAGDRLAGVAGRSLQSFSENAEGADDRARRVAIWQRLYRALHGPAGSVVTLALIDPSGGVRTVDAERVVESGELVTLGNLPPLHVRTSVRGARTPSGNTAGVIGFSAWMTTVATPFAEAVDTYRSAAGIVVDLRGNPGGLAEMIRGIAGHFLRTPELLGRVHMRGVELEFRANPRRSTADGRRVEPFSGPVAILVDELTASASECFAGGLQSLGRARVFGTQSMGQALPASTLRLPNDDVLMFAVGDFVTSTGQTLEGAGVIPDVPVPISAQALGQGRDPVLDAALAWIDDAAGR